MDGEATVAIVHGAVELTSWPLAGSGCPDLAVVDDLARLCLAARRAGYAVQLRDAGAALTGLLDLIGLRHALCVEVGGQPEVLEEGSVEEVVVPDDPVA